MADREFTSRAQELAVAGIETKLIDSTRDWQDAERAGDEIAAADALRSYAVAKREYDALTGASQQQQQPPGQLSVAQQNFLSRRAAGGDQITPERLQDYAHAHQRAIGAGLRQDTPEYFAAISRAVDTQGDGRQPPLDEREAASFAESMNRPMRRTLPSSPRLRRVANIKPKDEP